jgi:predicted DNA-binding helix-hairpin-helix protein
VFLGIDGRMRVSVGDLYLSPGYSQPENIATCISTMPIKCLNHTRDYYPHVHPPPMPPAAAAAITTAIATATHVAMTTEIATSAAPTATSIDDIVMTKSSMDAISNIANNNIDDNDDASARVHSKPSVGALPLTSSPVTTLTPTTHVSLTT